MVTIHDFRGAIVTKVVVPGAIGRLCSGGLVDEVALDSVVYMHGDNTVSDGGEGSKSKSEGEDFPATAGGDCYDELIAGARIWRDDGSDAAVEGVDGGGDVHG